MYFCFEDYFYPNTPIIEVRKEDLIKVPKHHDCYQILINNQLYYFKIFNRFCYDWFYNELLGEEISKYFNLDTVEYSIAKVKFEECDYSYGLLSKNFKNNKNRFVDYDNIAQDLNLERCFFEQLAENNGINVLANNIKKMYNCDWLFCQQDRHGENFTFEIENGTFKLAPLYDYSIFSLILDEFCYSPKIDFGDYKEYFNQYSSTYPELLKNDLMFQYLFRKTMLLNIRVILNKIKVTKRIIIPKELEEWYVARIEYRKYMVENVLIKKLVK